MDSIDVEIMQAVAYVFSQSVAAQAEIAAMNAANLERQHRGEAMAYGEAAFIKVIETYDLSYPSVNYKLYHIY
jgi:hypothetical protein